MTCRENEKLCCGSGRGHGLSFYLCMSLGKAGKAFTCSKRIYIHELKAHC